MFVFASVLCDGTDHVTHPPPNQSSTAYVNKDTGRIFSRGGQVLIRAVVSMINCPTDGIGLVIV
jgi:hypothetical protein